MCPRTKPLFEPHCSSQARNSPNVSEAVMRFNIAYIDNLRNLYAYQIQHLHSAEAQIIEALPEVVEAASDPELKGTLQTHSQETREQVSQLQNILDHTAGKPESKRSKAMAA